MKVLVIDIGNSNIKLGVMLDGELLASWRCNTDIRRTGDEYAANLLSMLASSNILPTDIHAVAMSSVVPQINYTISNMVQYYFGREPFVVSHANCGMPISYTHPHQLGCDRICTAVEAYRRYNSPLIVIDFGTATTYNCIDSQGRFLGGAITLGVRSTMDALSNAASQLHTVELSRPDNAIANTTASAIQSGIYHSIVGQIHHIVDVFCQQCGSACTVVATGGMSTLFEGEGLFDHIDRELSLYGIYHIWQANN